MRSRLLEEGVTREVSVGQREGTRRQPPAPRAHIAPEESQAHQRMRATLCRAGRHADAGGELRQTQRTPLAAERFENGERLLHRTVEERVARWHRAWLARRALHLKCSIELSIMSRLRGGPWQRRHVGVQ